MVGCGLKVKLAARNLRCRSWSSEQTPVKAGYRHLKYVGVAINSNARRHIEGIFSKGAYAVTVMSFHLWEQYYFASTSCLKFDKALQENIHNTIKRSLIESYNSKIAPNRLNRLKTNDLLQRRRKNWQQMLTNKEDRCPI